MCALGCDGKSNGPPPEPAARPETEATTAAASAGEEAPAEVPDDGPPSQATGPCRAEPPNVLLAPAPEVPAVAIAQGLVVFPESADALGVQAIDERARPAGERREVAIEGARGLFALRRVGDRYIVLTQHDTGSARTIVAQALDATGSPVGDPARVGLPERLLTTKVRPTDDALLLARSHAQAAPVVDRFALGRDGIAHTSFALGLARDPESRRVEILGLATEGDRWLVAWRAGAAEATSSEVVLTSNAPFGRAARTLDTRAAGGQATYEGAIEALHHALAIESFGFDGDSVVAIAAHEMSRPALVRITRESERASPITRGEPPAPFADRLSARALVAGDRLALELRDAAGDRVGETLVAAGIRDAVADVARTDGGFLVAYAGAEANGRVVNASYIACDGSRARADD